jgi:hypothetical protein
MSGWFEHTIVDSGRLRLFCFLVAFIVAFLFIRVSVRMIRAQVKWWPGNVTPGGVHYHHVVFGLVFMCIGGVGGLAVSGTHSGWAAAAAALLGIGMALVLDEFALVLHLKDVYWSEQGRLSVDVVFIAVALCGLALVGFTPLGLTSSGSGSGLGAALGIAVVLTVNVALTVLCLLKGKIWFAIIGIYIVFFSLVGAIRLARPGSAWARRRYHEGSRKLARAQAREERRVRRSRIVTRFQDFVAGKPDGASQPDGAAQPELAAQPDATARPDGVPLDRAAPASARALRAAPTSAARYRADEAVASSVRIARAKARICPYIRFASSLSRSSSLGCCGSPACSR